MTDHPYSIDTDAHRAWLATQTAKLLEFSKPALDPTGGFSWLDDAGAPVPAEGSQLWLTGRYTYCAVLGHLLGFPEQAERVEHGLAFLRSGALRDAEHGGWFVTAGAADPESNSETKESYGHAFVLLAAASAKLAGFDADDLYADVLAELERWWEADPAMYADTWNREFTVLDPYRGANPNMHLVEAGLLAYEADRDPRHIERSTAVARRLIGEVTAGNGWRLPEHYREDWTPDPEYGADSPDSHFRPYGATVGHWLEWARLLVALETAQREALGAADPWLIDASQRLFARAVADAWDEDRGGFAFSTNWRGEVLNDHRFHWVIAEAVGTSAVLYRVTGDPAYAEWYARFWEYAASRHIEADGSWIHELDAGGARANGTWSGKPDLYHALQATLFARLPATHSLTHGLRAGGLA
ncbi:AGE family epimerase/isomerase [Leucobacter sp. wl10]|uniref:AGE family epimerase/isomerase n=1 Tax=Leucobacter sp. wl10 TaxID=2304677 RepID=UPI000E5C410B|nr:AGE family epimerase/isomerase [Leucobacter sp. wl10]RGE16740.1 AGE family epimerase/isomerase [Leucobacter sp. wl10]